MADGGSGRLGHISKLVWVESGSFLCSSNGPVRLGWVDPKTLLSFSKFFIEINNT